MNFIEATAHLNALAKAEAAGQKIQVRSNSSAPWEELKGKVENVIGFVFLDPDDFRIAPEPKLRPWTIDEVPIGAVVRHKTDGDELMIIGKVSPGAASLGGNRYASPEALFKHYTLLDGSPCGKEVAE